MRHAISSLIMVLTLGLVLAPQAQSQLFDAKRIELVHGNTDPDGAPEWHIAEIEAYETGTGTNIALGGTAAYTTGVSTFGTIPGDANDGNTDGNFGNGSVWHSANEGAGSTFEIDLAIAATLDSIDLYGRTDCCQSRDDDLTLNIYDSMDELIFSAPAGIPNGGPAGGPAQFISIPVQGNAPVPEPTTVAIWLLLGSGLAGYGVYRRKK